eukprot:SAG31_NODE_19241_length_608_cov_1.282908_1_plen_99_part_10
MPYEVAGNAAAGYAQSTGGFGGGVRRRASSSGAGPSAMAVLCCPCVVGFILTIVGISYLASAAHDSRGDKLQQWHDAMAAWQPSGLNSFKAQAYSLAAA